MKTKAEKLLDRLKEDEARAFELCREKDLDCENCPLNSEGSTEPCAKDYITYARQAIAKNFVRRTVMDNLVHKGWNGKE